MRDIGIKVVRIGEFAWSRLEPKPGDLQFDWLQQAMDTLHTHELKIVLGTPTATPPRWVLDKHPDMLAIDEHGKQRNFGSRRHYCFSSRAYREECDRITTLIAKRFGQHPGLLAWQTDNEFGCHDTILSYSNQALEAFRTWCRERYGDIQKLNDAWGNVFWSMEYTSFDDIDAPVSTVTEANPAHTLAYWRFSSDQVASFNKLQVDILNRHSPGKPVSHNFMGFFTSFDHHQVSRDLDIATWDSYPLGFLARDITDENEKQTWLRTGHPDSVAFHHDLYRGCTGGRWWVMEQQPGPVNWAPYNPTPLPDMVRLWSWEAFAHGAEVVSYFRWRQAPFAQEQMHAGLLLPQGGEATAAAQVRQVNEEIAQLSHCELYNDKAPAAIVMDYVGLQMQAVQQPADHSQHALTYTLTIYSALRSCGLDVDVVAPEADLSGYAIVCIATSTYLSESLTDKLNAIDGNVLLFPQSGSRTTEFSIPSNLPPGHGQSLIPLRVVQVDTVPKDFRWQLDNQMVASEWREMVVSEIAPHTHFADGWGCLYEHGKTTYINARLNSASLVHVLQPILAKHAITATHLPRGVRTRRRGNVQFLFNFGPDSFTIDTKTCQALGVTPSTTLLLGKHDVPVAGMAAWERTD